MKIEKIVKFKVGNKEFDTEKEAEIEVLRQELYKIVNIDTISDNEDAYDTIIIHGVRIAAIINEIENLKR